MPLLPVIEIGSTPSRRQTWVVTRSAGKCCTQEGNRAAADSVYALVAARHPRSDRAPTSLYKLAQSRRAAGQAAAARPLLERIVRDYPRSDEAALARDLLRAR